LSNPWSGIDCDWHEHPDSAAKRNADRLVCACRRAGLTPQSAATGKWSSVCLFWDDGRTEVEVFDDHFELYFLPRSRTDGTFDVTHFDADAPDVLALVIGRIRAAHETLRE